MNAEVCILRQIGTVIRRKVKSAVRACPKPLLDYGTPSRVQSVQHHLLHLLHRATNVQPARLLNVDHVDGGSNNNDASKAERRPCRTVELLIEMPLLETMVSSRFPNQSWRRGSPSDMLPLTTCQSVFYSSELLRARVSVGRSAARPLDRPTDRMAGLLTTLLVIIVLDVVFRTNLSVG